MTNILITRGFRWQTLAFLLVMSAGSTVVMAQDWRSGSRGQSSERNSGNRQRQSSGNTWRDAVRQQRGDSSRQNRQGSQNRRDNNRQATPQPRRDSDRQSSRQSRRDADRQSRRNNRDDRPRNAQQGSNSNSRRDQSRRNQTWAEAARQQRERRRNEGQGRGDSRRERNRREQAFQNYRRRGHHSRRHYSVGHKLRRLPRNHSRFSWNNYSYFYGNGYFYRPSSYGYVVVGAPLGFRLSVLPLGYATFYLASDRYHYVNDTYYRWYSDTNDYEVVDEPNGAADALYRVSEIAAASLYIYPTQGQTEEQRDQDRFECHLWAVDESGFDPSYSDADKAGYENYRRAMTACLEGRGYSVK